MTWISPHFQDTDFPSGMSTEQKIDIFTDRVEGWQLDIAEQCVENISHSGFAVLHIVASYFEMIAKFEHGFANNGKSKEYFKKGVYSVFPELNNYTPNVSITLINILYEHVRCGLYHSGITGPDIILTGDVESAISFSTVNQRVVINPHKLVPAIKQHLQSYTQKIRNTQNNNLRDNFERRFNYQPK